MRGSDIKSVRLLKCLKMDFGRSIATATNSSLNERTDISSLRDECFANVQINFLLEKIFVLHKSLKTLVHFLWISVWKTRRSNLLHFNCFASLIWREWIKTCFELWIKIKSRGTLLFILITPKMIYCQSLILFPQLLDHLTNSVCLDSNGLVQRARAG